MSPRWRGALQDAALVVASTGVVLLGLEAAFRVAGFEPGGERAVRRMVGPHGTPLVDCFPSNPRGYFEIDLRDKAMGALYRGLAPHRFDAIARDHRWAVEVRYNALGFRDVPPAPRPRGVRRIVVLGDSFAEGQGVKEADTLARVLERLLEERAPGRYEVRNCGRRGLDFPELFGSFEDALAYEPDLVIYTLTLNDAVQPPEFHERQSFVNDWILDRTREPDTPQAPPSPFRPRVFDFVSERVSALLIGRQTTRFYLDMWGDANRRGFEKTQEYLSEMKRRLAERGARLLIAPWPLFVGLEQGYPFAPVHDRIQRFCLVAQIPHHDLLKAFEGRPSAGLWVHPVDHHPNEIAHRIAAEVLAPEVLKLVAP
jgi:lysophospholipase L1-like esterase